MFNKNILMMVVLSFIIALVFMGSVCAADNVTQTFSSNNDEILSVENDVGVLSANEGTYSDLKNEIGSEENIVLRYDDVNRSEPFTKVDPLMDAYFPDNIAADGNFTFYVVVGENATNNAVVSIDGVDYEVSLVDGYRSYDIVVGGSAGTIYSGGLVHSIPGISAYYPLYESPAKVVEYTICNLSLGKHNVSVTYLGDDYYNSGSTNVSYFTVCKYSSHMSFVHAEVDGNVTLVFNVTGYSNVNVTGNVRVHEYVAPVIDGIARVNVGHLPAGDYKYWTAFYSGDDNYYESSTYLVFFSVGRIITSDVVKYYNGYERLVVYLGGDGKGIAFKEVNITINGVTYTRTTDANGSASIAINLIPGNYSAIVESGYLVETANIEVKHTIYAEDVVKVFRNDTQYYALFLDDDGNPLANTNVTFNIHGVFYTRTTNATGWAKLNINLEKGHYILTAINPVTGEMKSNNITVFTRLETSDLTKYYHNDSQFVARVMAADGSYAGAGECVIFYINGAMYIRHTNATGHVVLNINLEPGDYIITTSYTRDIVYPDVLGYNRTSDIPDTNWGVCEEGNNIHVLPVLSAKDLKMGHIDGSKFTAHVLDGQGKPYANQTVTFNVNGVFYNRTTDSNGDAKLNINLQAGEYIITSTYNGGSISNKITIGG